MTAVAVPPLALLICGAIDLGTVMNDRSRFQAVADATALQAAPQVSASDPTGLAARDDQFAREQLAELADRATYTVTTSIAADQSTVTVDISGIRNSFFANLLPPGGWHIAAHATAAALARTPLCMLSTGTDKKGDITLDTSAQISAPACMVQSNHDISVTQSAQITAGLVQSAGLASGNISPAPQVGAPQIDDPFGNLTLRPDDKVCTPGDKLTGTLGALVNGLIPLTISVPAGVHCGDIHVASNQTVTLEAGEHYFLKGNLKIDGTGTLRGTDVVLIFDKDSKFDFQDKADIELEGRKSGPLGGFVLATTRENNHDFHISSSSAAKFLGTIYVPSATFAVDGAGNKVAEQSAWTIIVAQALRLKGSPRLVLNANYDASSIPVPSGVGPNPATRLIK